MLYGQRVTLSSSSTSQGNFFSVQGFISHPFPSSKVGAWHHPWNGHPGHVQCPLLYHLEYWNALTSLFHQTLCGVIEGEGHVLFIFIVSSLRAVTWCNLDANKYWMNFSFSFLPHLIYFTIFLFKFQCFSYSFYTNDLKVETNGLLESQGTTLVFRRVW